MPLTIFSEKSDGTGIHMFSEKKNGSERMMQPISGSSFEAVGERLVLSNPRPGFLQRADPIAFPERLPRQTQRQMNELGKEPATGNEVAGEWSLNSSGSPTDNALKAAVGDGFPEIHFLYRRLCRV